MHDEARWRNDPRAYEQACLEATRDLFAAVAPARHADGTYVQEISLDGDYPETELVVTWRDERFDNAERARRFALWPQEQLAAPETVASGIEIEVQQS
jgi:hypothetical protein